MENSSSPSSRRRAGGGGGIRRSPFGLGAKSKRGAAARQSDSSILRGAEIIRQQIRKQLEEEDAFRKSREVRDNLIEGSGSSSKKTRSFSSDDEHEEGEGEDQSTLFSDPWIENQANGARRSFGDSSTVHREMSYSACSTGSEIQGMSQVSITPKKLDYSSPASEDLSPPPPPPDDYDDGVECYTPLSTLRRENAQAVRILKVSRKGSNGDESDDGTYGFVGDDYDSELDMDDRFNSSNVEASYLPNSLRTKNEGKSWSPNAVSTVVSAKKASPFKKGVAPRRLQDVPETPSSEPSISVKAKAPSKSTSSAQRSGRESQAENTPQRQPLPFWSRLSSGGKSKQLHHPSPRSTATLRLISPTQSEKSDRLELNQRRGRTSADLIPSPLSVEYDMMLHDPAFCHARGAGLLWQSIVGQQVRFPTRWWNGARGPPMGIIPDAEGDAQDSEAKWEYFGIDSVANSRQLNRLVPNRSKPGRLLLHMIVLQLGRPVADVVVGMYHPNARGVRAGKESSRELERSRTLYLAIRKRTTSCKLLELKQLAAKFPDRSKTPLESNRRITNQNIRAVYGEEAPLETLFVPQQELETRLAQPRSALALVQEFVFD